jgi:hypothetical protein
VCQAMCECLLEERYGKSSFIVIFISETFHNRFVSRDPPSFSAEVKGRVELYLYSPSGPWWPVLG